ncbi:MAG TPA: AAA family ATPase, partial [Cellvibrionaceae bacterium]
MYHQYFGLSESAFSIAVNPRYLYMSGQHKEALAHLLYGVQGGGFVLLTGEVGTGKTTIIRSLLEQLPEQTDIAMVFNPMASVPEILGMICDELQVEYDKGQSSVKYLTDRLHSFLLNNHARGRNTVLLIDEAQLLSAEVLEQVRLLTNLETNTQKLLQIILVGQPELNTLLSQPRLRQLAQRITARFHLSPLGLAETRAYIAHRLQVAGLNAEKNPFTPAIVKKIHSFSGGIPRRINILCERILIGLYGHNQHLANNKIFTLAKKEVVGNLDDPGIKQRYGSAWLMLLPLFLFTGLVAVWLIIARPQ